MDREERHRTPELMKLVNDVFDVSACALWLGAQGHPRIEILLNEITGNAFWRLGFHTSRSSQSYIVSTAAFTEASFRCRASIGQPRRIRLYLPETLSRTPFRGERTYVVPLSVYVHLQIGARSTQPMRRENKTTPSH